MRTGDRKAGAIAPALTAAVTEAARRLSAAYGTGTQIRHDDTGERAGAWLLTGDGQNNHLGITATLTTRHPDPGSETLGRPPAGTTTIGAYIAGRAVRPGPLAAVLPTLPGWNSYEHTAFKGGYHLGPAGSIEDALTRCLRFVPPARWTARFTAEAWVNDTAIEVDPAGPREWDCTAYARQHAGYLAEMAQARREDPDSCDGVLDTDDLFKDDPAAPAWVRGWTGPFTIRITRTAAP